MTSFTEKESVCRELKFNFIKSPLPRENRAIFSVDDQID